MGVRIVVLLCIAFTVAVAEGQTIQLPTFGQTGVQTTVIVPDRGSVSLGGFAHSRQSRLRFAPPFFGRLSPNRAITASRGIGNMQMHVWVHDLQAMDQAILTKADRRKAGQQSVATQRPVTTGKPQPVHRLPPGN